MSLSNICKYGFLNLVIYFSFMSASSQVNLSVTNQDFELDSSIRHGKIPNGLTYFIRPMADSVPKVNLQLLNKAGSNQEDEDQRAMAHAIEHLAFYSSELFPEGLRNSDIMDKLGMGMYDFYASSGRRTTIYNFDAPNNTVPVLEAGLLWFKDIITGLRLEEKDIITVKGELRQEYIMKEGDDLSNNISQGKTYSDLIPCYGESGSYLDDIKGLRPESFKRFYNDWYRPDLMGISVVGNIQELDQIERLIVRIFSDIPPPLNPREKFDCDAAYYNQPPKFTVVERPNDLAKLTGNNTVKFHLLYRDPILKDILNTKEGSQRRVKMQLVTDILQKRLKETTNDYLASEYLVTNPYKVWDLAPALEIIIADNNGKEKESLRTAIRVFHQLRTHGVLKEEWERLKENQLKYLNVNEEKKPPYWSDGIQLFFNNEEALPSGKINLLKEWLHNYTLEEFNDFVSIFLSNTPEDIGVLAPTGNRALKYTEKGVRSWIEEAHLAPIKAYELPEVPVSIISEEDIQNLKEKSFTEAGPVDSGAREIVLSNGLKVILKPFSHGGPMNKSIFLHGFTLEGAGDFPPEHYASAVNAPSIIRNSGVNGMTKFNIDRFLTTSGRNQGNIKTYIDFEESGIYGNADPMNFETMLQLVYLHFTRPNEDRLAFEDWKEGSKKSYQNSGTSLIDLDNRAAIKNMTGDLSMERVLGMRIMGGTKGFKTVEKTDFEKAFAIYKEVFGDPRAFTFLISGDFEVEHVLPLVQKYLGNLPIPERGEDLTPKTAIVNPLAPGPVYLEFSAPGDYELKNISYSIRFLQPAVNPNDWKEELKVQLLGLITTHKAWSLRFNKGFSLYQINVHGLYNPDMERFELGGTFDCVPEEFPMIREELHQIITEIKSGDISDDVFREATSRMEYLYSAEQANEGRAMQEKLYKHYRYGLPWVETKFLQNYVQSFTIDDVVETANRYFKGENRFEFVMKD